MRVVASLASHINTIKCALWVLNIKSKVKQPVFKNSNYSDSNQFPYLFEPQFPLYKMGIIFWKGLPELLHKQLPTNLAH